jgi:alpha-tubulin suppressor-like RCC1 family protein
MTSRGPTGRTAAPAGLAFALLAALACSPAGEDVGVARLAITEVPTDTRCIRITVSGSRQVVRDFTVIPGAAAAFSLGQLPLGPATFLGEAFSPVCPQVAAGTAPGWVSDPAPAVVATNPPVQVTLTMRRNGRASVVIDFLDEPDGGAPPDGGTGTATAWAQVSAGGRHTCATTAAGTVWCWGQNVHGPLGDGTFVDSNRPRQVPGLSGVASVQSGLNHTCAVVNDRTVRCWGGNNFGQLGVAPPMDRTSPVEVLGLGGVQSVSLGSEHTCALMQDGGRVRCWGNGAFGQLGDGAAQPRSTPAEVPGLGGVTLLSAGGRQTCARLGDASVRCWGENLFDPGAHRLTPAAVSGLPGAVSVSAGLTHACAVLTDGGVRCWGVNEDGRLGDGTQADSETPVAVSGLTGVASVSAGGLHTCATLTDASLRCWGFNFHGQLGDGSTTDRSSPVAVTDVAGATSVSAGGIHTCAMLGDASLHCWGSNVMGQLGDPNQSVTRVRVPVPRPGPE